MLRNLLDLDDCLVQAVFLQNPGSAPVFGVSLSDDLAGHVNLQKDILLFFMSGLVYVD